MLENESLKLQDGRTLSYAIYGSPVPRTSVVYMHGFPSSRLEGKLWHSACTKHGIRLISPDRPGIGASTFQPNRRIIDWPADVLALADHLKIQEFYMLGMSGGASYALACINSSLLKARCVGATVVSGLYPTKLGTMGMMTQTRVLFWVAPYLTRLTSMLYYNTMGKAARNNDKKIFEEVMAQEVKNGHRGDQKIMKDPTNWPTFIAMMRESFRQSGEGIGWETRLNGSEWGYDLSALNVGHNGIPLTLWHGTEDTDCPVAAAKKANELMPGSKLHLREGEGHVSFILRDVDEILQHLVGVEETLDYIKVVEQAYL